jgi:hypothetical protein
MLNYRYAQMTKLRPYYVFLTVPRLYSVLDYSSHANQKLAMIIQSTTPTSISLSTVIIPIVLYCWPSTHKLSLSWLLPIKILEALVSPLSAKYWYHTNDFTTVEEGNNPQNSLSCNSFIPVSNMARDISNSYELLS